MGKPVSHIPFINRCGGVDVILSHLKKVKVFKSINNTLGNRVARAEYTYADALQTWILNVFAGSRRLEHIHKQKSALKTNPKFAKALSPDTVSRVFRALSVDNVYYSKRDGRTKSALIENPTDEQKLAGHEINCNTKLNELTIDTAIALNLFKPGVEYVLDIDATVVRNNVSDSRITYNGEAGYIPMVVLLNGIPVYIETRNGNTTPATRVFEVLKAAIDLIESRNLKIKIVRSDAAGCKESIMDYLNNKGLKFIVRAHGNLVKKRFVNLRWLPMTEKYKHFKTSDWNTFIGEVPVKMVNYQKLFKGKKSNTVITDKTWSIFTNDQSLTAHEIIELYNKRGGIEQSFSLLNELGWNYMPHREMKHNSTYMHITLLTFVLFTYLKRLLSKTVTFVRPEMELATFIAQFINVITYWKDGRLRYLEREDEYAPLKGFV